MTNNEFNSIPCGCVCAFGSLLCTIEAMALKANCHKAECLRQTIATVWWISLLRAHRMYSVDATYNIWIDKCYEIKIRAKKLANLCVRLCEGVWANSNRTTFWDPEILIGYLQQQRSNINSRCTNALSLFEHKYFSGVCSLREMELSFGSTTKSVRKSIRKSFPKNEIKQNVTA